MKWFAELNDGSKVKEGEIFFKDLDISTVDKVIVCDSKIEHNIVVSLLNGYTNFNIDLIKAKDFVGGEELRFRYDKDCKNFILDQESLKLLNSIYLDSYKDFNFISVSSTGDIILNGKRVNISLNIDGDVLPFVNSERVSSIVHYREAHIDMVHSSVGVKKATPLDAAYILGYTKKVIYKDTELTVEPLINFNVDKGVVSLELSIMASKETFCNRNVFYTENSSMGLCLPKGEKVKNVERLFRLA